MEEKVEGMLTPYRVLDLTDEKGLLCGKILGDLGADVIKIERPGGDPARKIGPFYHDDIDPEKSLLWWAFNTNKRGITLDIETAAGQETFRKLVETADFVIESFPPGYMDKLGLGYSALEKVNPGIIMVSITPFGQMGPYKDWKITDIVACAMGGMMYPWGDPDRPPIRISHHSQAYLHAASHAVEGALLALHHRGKTGEGQWVDVSIEESVASVGDYYTLYWDMMKVNLKRGESDVRNVRAAGMWLCKDGLCLWRYSSGYQANHKNLPLIEWMDSEGMADDFLKGVDWDNLDIRTADQEMLDCVAQTTEKFLMKHTKAELMEGAVKRRLQLYPVATTKEVLESVQLTAREFWVKLEHPELGTTITYPGAFTKASEAPPRISRRAPLIGEHNQEILEEELGLSKKELQMPSQAKDYLAKVNKKSNGENPTKNLLEGIRVADFTWIFAGPITTRVFANYGAEVIKIEGRSRPDPARVNLGPVKDGIPGVNRNGWFLARNTNKLSVATNLACPEGVELAKKFVARSDIVVDNFAGGVMERMGLGYEELKKVKPDIIMLSSCMQGQTGPHFNHPGLGITMVALSGLSQISGWPDRQPVGIGVYTDYIAAHYMGVAVMAALEYRRRTGKGQFIDLSHYETAAQFTAPLILDYVANQRVASRMGNRYTDAAPHGAFRCQGEDRWCAIAVFTDEEWQNFSRVIGNPAWTNDPRFSTLPERKDNEDELERLVEEWTISHSAEEVMTMMQAAMVGAGVVQTGEDLMEHDPQLKYRHFFWEVNHPEIGNYHPRRPPFVLSKSPCEVRTAPLLGEHTEYALKEILGMSDEEIADLVVAGAAE